MRFLAANRSKFSVFEFSANVMRSIAVVRQVDGQLCRHPRQSKIGCTNQFQNRGSHELQEGDDSGHRIAWTPEHRAFIQSTDTKRLSRIDRHAPDRERGCKVVYCVLNQVVRPNRYTAANNWDVIYECAF